MSKISNTIKFNSNGKLKIMHITDTHFEPNRNIDSLIWMISKACDKEKPDVVILTGDNVVNGKSITEIKALIASLMSIFESKNIPVAVTFGNHDTETGSVTREELMAYYNTFSCSVSGVDSANRYDCGTYNVPVFESDSDKVKFNLWVFDSGDYDEKGRYSCVKPDAIEWYKKTSAKLTADNDGKKVNSFAFQHIIVAEIYDALKKRSSWQPYAVKHLYNKKDYYTFNPKCVNYGTMKEYPCPGFYNFGQFDAMLETGDVLALFTGHDHTNGFGVMHKGIDIYTSLAAQYRGVFRSTQYGYRVIEIDEKNTSVYKTHSVKWCDIFNFDYAKSIKEKGDKHSYKLARELALKGVIQKTVSNIYRSVAEKLTRRQVTYPD